MDDLISRQATYLALVEKGQASKRYKLGETWELNGEEIREVLDALPSAQPERKTGRWIEMSSTNHTYKCSVCGRLLVNITDGKNKVAKNYPYCHCGADMRPTERNMGKEQRNIRGKRENRNDKTRAMQ